MGEINWCTLFMSRNEKYPGLFSGNISNLICPLGRNTVQVLTISLKGNVLFLSSVLTADCWLVVQCLSQLVLPGWLDWQKHSQWAHYYNLQTQKKNYKWWREERKIYNCSSSESSTQHKIQSRITGRLVRSEKYFYGT